MGGHRLISYRSGDRSEYLANYALSRIAFVNPVPHQEDFGVVDYLCVLTRAEKKFVYPESSFYVQVKSNRKPIDFDLNTLSWISNYMDHPLILCVVDKKKQQIKMYSCWPIWRLMFPCLRAKRLVVRLGGSLPISKPKELAGEQSWELYLGPPIIDKSLDAIEADPDSCYAVLKDWLHLDAQNIARRRIGRIAVVGIKEWETNRPISEISRIKKLYFAGGDCRATEMELLPILEALAHSYKYDHELNKLEALNAYMVAISN